MGPRRLEAGFRAAHAVPLRLRGDVLGALNLFRSEAVALTAADLSTAQALADVASERAVVGPGRRCRPDPRGQRGRVGGEPQPRRGKGVVAHGT